MPFFIDPMPEKLFINPYANKQGLDTPVRNPVMLRNFIIFSLILAACVIGLGFHVFKSAEEIKQTDREVNHSQAVIIMTQDLNNIIITTLAQQRNYILNGDEEAFKKYEEARILMSSQIAQLRGKVQDNPEQSSRLTEVEHLSLRLKDALDDYLDMFKDTKRIPLLQDSAPMVVIRDNMLRLTNDVLTSEYNLLFSREREVSKTIDRYQISLLISGIVASLIILIFNWFLLEAQSKISVVEASMKESEERMRLAIRGSNDGIFDWNLKTHDIYWSPQFKLMLGYEDGDITASEEEFRRLLYPEDSEQFWECFNNYINGNLSEFSCIFRMTGKSGRPIWIHGRGKALFDEEGHPVRFIGAHTDISYLKEHERQLKDERDRAEAASNAKGEFLAHMSHEIRTPLTAVSGIAEILSQTPGAVNDNYSKLVATLKNSTETLKELITDILDFSKIESGEVELHNQKFLLGELFEQVSAMMSVKASEKYLDFTFDYQDVAGTLFHGDKLRLRQIMINLIGNAIKFTEKGFITLRARIEPVGERHILRIDVQDSGIGISPAAIPVIFEKFRQADSSVSRRYGGTGLGLPISKSLADIMGGTIEVQSQAGMGSTFSLILPFNDVHAEEEEMDMSEVVRMQKLNDRLKTAIAGRKHVLMAEDYEGNVVVLSYILNELNCTFEVAKTGLEAVQLWKGKHYDLILMDVQMPEMDGLTATRIIRNVEEEQGLGRTPIIGLTAHALVADKQKCIDSGMDDYLSKPIVEADLKNAILNILEKQPGLKTQAV